MILNVLNAGNPCTIQISRHSAAVAPAHAAVPAVHGLLFLHARLSQAVNAAVQAPRAIKGIRETKETPELPVPLELKVTKEIPVCRLAGPQGEKGEKGDQGDAGEKGDKGDKGDTGDAATITVGRVSTGAPGTNVQITNTGTPENAVFNFVIPRGEPGDTGAQGPEGPQGPAGPTGATAPSIYAQQGKCRNHAAFSTLKTIKQPL